MKYIIRPLLSKKIHGTAVVPASKSYAQRAIALSMLVDGKTILYNVGDSDDEKAAMSIIKDSGAQLEIEGDKLIIKSKGYNPTVDFEAFVHESGLSTRMFTPILANTNHNVLITGLGSILGRPMDFFDVTLPKLGISISMNKGKLPIKLQGPLKPCDLEVDGSLSSQYITGLLYGYVASPYLGKQQIKVKNLQSRPYLELSLDVLKEFGVSVSFKEDTLLFVGPYHLKPSAINIEADWSSASFLILLGALFGSIRLKNLNRHSKQADIKFLIAIQEYGANVYWEDQDLIVEMNEKNAFDFDATHCPDLFPPLAVLATLGTGRSSIKGLHRLFHKESNRAETIREEFSKLGGRITLDIENDLMLIDAVDQVSGGTVSSRGDHRIAMALSVLGLAAKNEVVIENAETVSKSFPSFFEMLEKLI